MATVAYISAFVPPEWIASHGHHPQRLVPTSTAAIPAGVCPLAAAFRPAPGGHLASGDALIFTTTCDQMRRVADEWIQTTASPTFALNVPATWQTPQARDLYQSELLRLGRFLVSLGGTTPSPSRLAAHMRQSATRLLPQRLAPTPRPGQARIAILGVPLRSADQWILDLLPTLNAALVLDATETGHRGLPAPFDESRLQTDPFSELARAYFDTIPDTFRRPDTLLYDYLRRELPARGVQGLVLARYTWCDLWHAQLARLKETFPLPMIEIDLGAPGEHRQRTRTRIESLVETIR